MSNGKPEDGVGSREGVLVTHCPQHYFLSISTPLSPLPSGDRISSEIKLLVRERIGGIASLKDVIFVDRLPRTRSGKILRKAMRAIADVGKMKVVGVKETGDERRRRRAQITRACLLFLLAQVPSTIESPAVLDEVRAALDGAVIGKYAEDTAARRAGEALVGTAMEQGLGGRGGLSGS